MSARIQTFVHASAGVKFLQRGVHEIFLHVQRVKGYFGFERAPSMCMINLRINNGRRLIEPPRDLTFFALIRGTYLVKNPNGSNKRWNLPIIYYIQ